MIVTLDANALVAWASQKAGDLNVARLDALFDTIAKTKGRLIIPTPALAELFVRMPPAAASTWMETLQRKQAFQVAPFDLRAAAECAAMHRRAEQAGGKRAHVKPGEAYQKIKVDRQIVSIALVHGSDLLVSDDTGLKTVATANSLRAIGLQELSVPDSAKQITIDEIPDVVTAQGAGAQPGAAT